MRPRVTSDSGMSSDSCETVDGDASRESASHSDRWCIRDGIKHLEQKITNIKAARSAFSKQFLAMNEEIDNMVKAMQACAQMRERNLKGQLQLIAQTRISEWERQLKVCRDAQEALNCSPWWMRAELALTCSAFTQNIGVIHSGRLEFKGDAEPLLRQIDALGKCLFSESEKAVFEKPELKLIIGGSGEKAGEFERPWGVCSDATGRILVADLGNNRIQVFNEQGKFEFEFGKRGSGPGQFDRPAGITVDSSLRIIVSDKDNHRVQVFSFSGYFLFSFGRKGRDPGQFQYPWDVAVDRDGNIAVSDTRNRRIQIFDSCGEFIKKCDLNVGINGLKKGVCPRGLVFGSDNSLLVTDFNNHCVLSITDDLTEVKKWKGGDQKMFRPQGIAYNGSGKVAVVDSKNNRVQVFDDSGSFLLFIGQKGNEVGEFDCPQDVCFQPNGSIVVTEFGNNRVQVL